MKRTHALRGNPGKLHSLRHWSLEFIYLVCATGLLSAVTITLGMYNGEEIPEWPLSMNINTLIALLSTLYRASIVAVLAEIISQAKWTWFGDGERPLKDLQTFDDASRSVWGSLRLIGLLKFGLWGSPLAVGAALITALSLAIGTFTQQSLKTIPCSKPLPHINSTIPIAHSLSVLQIDETTDDFGANIGVRAALIGGLINPKGNDSKIQASCPTGNCTFPEINQVTHATLGLCSKCMNTVDFVETYDSEQRRNTKLGGMSLPDEDISRIRPSNLSFATGSMDLEFKESYKSSISGFSVLARSSDDYDVISNTSTWSIVAASCILYPCMKNIAVKVESGQVKETVISTLPALDQVVGLNHSSVVKSPCVVDGKVYTIGNFSAVPNITSQRTFTEMNVKGEEMQVPTDCYYYMHSRYKAALRQFLEDSLLSGGCNLTSCEEKWWLIPLLGDRNSSFEKIEQSFNQLATVATNCFRRDGLGPQNSSSDPQSKQLIGQVYETTVCIQLDASWLIMPSTLYLITIVLFVTSLLVIRVDKYQPVWKSSILPLMFYGFDPLVLAHEKGGDGCVAQNIGKLQHEAEKVFVRFQLGSDSKRASFTRVCTEQAPGYEIQSEIHSLLETNEGILAQHHKETGRFLRTTSISSCKREKE